MTKRIAIAILWSLMAFPQAQTPLTVFPSGGSAVGELRLSERRINGRNYVGIRAPQSATTDLMNDLPSAHPTSNGQCLTSTSAGVWSWVTCPTQIKINDYIWTRTNGTDASADLSATGVKAITLTPCPVGVDATDTKNWAYISGGTGTAEAAQYTTSGGAGTCTSGAATGTIKVTTANTHTGSWTIANAGFREAINVAVAGDILLSTAMTVYGPSVIDKSLTVECGSLYGTGGACTVTASGNFHAIDIDHYAAVHLRGFGLIASTPQSSGAGVRIGVDGSTNHNCSSRIEDMTIGGFYYGLEMKDACKSIISRVEFSDNVKYDLYVRNDYCPDCGDSVVESNTFFTAGGTDAAIYMTSAGGLRVINNKILGPYDWGVDLNANTPASPTGYLHVQNNNIDQIGNGGVRLTANYAFSNIKVENNIIVATGTGSVCMQVNAQVEGVSFIDNNCVAADEGVEVTGGTAVRFSGNSFSSASSAAPVVPSVETAIDKPMSLTYAQLPSDASDGSVLYCSNCNTTCTAGGSTGAFVRRINNTWSCDSGSVLSSAILQGGNTFGATVVIGSNDNQDINFERNGSTVGYFNASGFGSTGFLQSLNGGLDVRLQANCGVAGCVGIFNANDFGFISDSTVRWRLTSAGMFRPESHATYDIGLTGTRVRSIFAQAGEFFASGGTSSGDYLKTRKLVLYDAAGSVTSPVSWDIQCDAHGVGVSQNSYCYMRDNAGANVWRSERVVSGSALDRTLWYTDLVPDTDGGQSLGSTSLEWNRIYADFLGDSSNTVQVFGGVSEFIQITPPSNNNGTLGISGTRFATIYAYDADFADDVTVSGTLTLPTGAVNGYILTSDASGNASWAAAGSGSLPAADNTDIIKGSSDATKLLRIEVDGFTTATTRTLTPQDANYTIAGTNVAQTFSGANTFSVGQTFSGSNTYNANQTYAGDIRFGTDNTYSIGVTGTRPTHIFTRNFSMSASGYISSGGQLNIQSGGTLDINSGGTLSANGTAGTSATKTVRASGGASDCTLIFTNGILTGGTC